jgi:hypothetical protein
MRNLDWMLLPPASLDWQDGPVITISSFRCDDISTATEWPLSITKVRNPWRYGRIGGGAVRSAPWLFGIKWRELYKVKQARKLNNSYST